MDNHGIEAIIFDLGNVVIDFDHSVAAERISHFCRKSGQEIFDLFFDSKLTRLFEEGKISPKDFYLKVKEMLDLDLSYENFVPIWNEIFFFSPKNRAVVGLAGALRANYKIFLLSNINILHFEYLKQHFPVFPIFHQVFTSFELRVAKPDPEIYQKVLQALNIVPEKVFYTDDRKELIESAQSLGINSRLFTSAPQLKKDILDLGGVFH